VDVAEGGAQVDGHGADGGDGVGCGLAVVV